MILIIEVNFPLAHFYETECESSSLLLSIQKNFGSAIHTKFLKFYHEADEREN